MRGSEEIHRHGDAEVSRAAGGSHDEAGVCAVDPREWCRKGGVGDFLAEGAGGGGVCAGAGAGGGGEGVGKCSGGGGFAAEGDVGEEGGGDLVRGLGGVSRDISGL